MIEENENIQVLCNFLKVDSVTVATRIIIKCKGVFYRLSPQCVRPKTFSSLNPRYQYFILIGVVSSLMKIEKDHRHFPNKISLRSHTMQKSFFLILKE